jgi:DNA modification methylase
VPLTVEWVPIGKVYLNPANPRVNDPGVPHLVASIRRFGWQQPIVAKRTGEVIAGNTRLKAAQSLALDQVPVVWFEGSELDATAYAIADNKTHEFATWDEPALAKILELLRAEDSLEGIGYSSDDIDELLAKLDAELPPNEVDDPGPQEPPIEPVTRVGDLWLLGDHRLLVGDSTSADDVARLLAGEKAALWSSDPPYCVNYTGNDRPIHDGKPSGKDWTHVYREVDIKDLGEFLDRVFAASLPHLAPRSAIYVWHAHVQQPTIAAVFERHGLLLHQVLVWIKPSAVFGHSYYRWRHEPCAFGWKQGDKPEHGVGQLDTVWEADWDGRARITTFHPTSKPTRLFEIPIEQHTNPGDITLELFSGSGSQIIAAEKLRRRCFAMEITPAFVDCTIDRWQQASGKTATLESTGQSFADVTAERKSS